MAATAACTFSSFVINDVIEAITDAGLLDEDTANELLQVCKSSSLAPKKTKQNVITNHTVSLFTN